MSTPRLPRWPRWFRWLAYYLGRPKLVLARAAMRWPARNHGGMTLLMWRSEHQRIVADRVHEVWDEAFEELHWSNLPEWQRDLIYDEWTKLRAAAAANAVEQS